MDREEGKIMSMGDDLKEELKFFDNLEEKFISDCKRNQKHLNELSEKARRTKAYGGWMEVLCNYLVASSHQIELLSILNYNASKLGLVHDTQIKQILEQLNTLPQLEGLKEIVKYELKDEMNQLIDLNTNIEEGLKEFNKKQEKIIEAFNEVEEYRGDFQDGNR